MVAVKPTSHSAAMFISVLINPGYLTYKWQRPTTPGLRPNATQASTGLSFSSTNSTNADVLAGKKSRAG